MKKIVLIISLFYVSLMIWGEDAPKLQKISDHVYAYVGITNASPSANSFGANAGLVVGKDAALVIDTLVSAKDAKRFLSDIKKVTDKPVKYVVNTHYHLDHSWGNDVFAKKGAVVIAHENSRLAMQKMEDPTLHPENFGMTAKDIKGTVLKAPDVTFRDSLQIDLGGITVELNYPGETHTNGSIFAAIPQDSVLFLGDALFTGYHPFIGEGNYKSWKKILTDLEKTTFKILVPGHGPLSTIEDVKAMKTYITEFDAKAKKLCKNKKPEDVSKISEELLKELPDQKRTEMPALIQMNLNVRYLKSVEEKK